MFYGKSVACFIAALLAAGALSSDLGAQQGKLYKWVDKDGNVHYSDQVPPEAVDQARQELNPQGVTVSEVERALSPEELAARAEAEKLAAQEQKAIEEQERQDQLMLASYGSEEDITRARDSKIEMLQRSIDTSNASLRSLNSSLADLTRRAADNERSGQPVSDTLSSAIADLRRKVLRAEQVIAQKQQEQAGVHEEFAGELERFRTMMARRDAARAQQEGQ